MRGRIETNQGGGAVATRAVRLGLVVAALLALSAVAADSKAESHPPQRSLPKPVDRVLTDGPAFHVDPLRGDDANDGSLEKPWKTIQHGERRLEPGDTLYLRQGVYYEKVYLTQSGTAESPITISAYPGELPVLDGGLREFLESPATSWRPVKEGESD
ncbi:MAG: hypothetical protein N2C14_00530, partial [Planctomycetales bacterium]